MHQGCLHTKSDSKLVTSRGVNTAQSILRKYKENETSLNLLAKEEPRSKHNTENELHLAQDKLIRNALNVKFETFDDILGALKLWHQLAITEVHEVDHRPEDLLVLNIYKTLIDISSQSNLA